MKVSSPLLPVRLSLPPKEDRTARTFTRLSVPPWPSEAMPVARLTVMAVDDAVVVGHHPVRAVAGDGVVAGAAAHQIGPGRGDADGRKVESVVGGGAEELVDVLQRVDAVGLGDGRGGRAGEQQVQRAAGIPAGAGPEVDGVARGHLAAIDDVAAEATIDDVVAGAAIDAVAAVAAPQRVVPAPPSSVSLPPLPLRKSAPSPPAKRLSRLEPIIRVGERPVPMTPSMSAISVVADRVHRSCRSRPMGCAPSAPPRLVGRRRPQGINLVPR